MTSRAESCPPKLVPRSATLAAVQAFSSRPANVNPLAKPLSKSPGAAAAAAAAGTKSVVRNKASPRPIKQQDAYRPAPIKSPSHSAAQAASARASPQKDIVLNKTPSELTAMYALRKSPKPTGDPIRKQKAEVDEGRDRGRPWLDSTIAIPKPVRPLPASAALTAILSLEPEISPGSTPYSASPPATTSNISAGMSAARAAAKKSATPATHLSGPSSKHLLDIAGQSSGSSESLLASKDELQSSLELETTFSTSVMYSPPAQVGQLGSENVQNANFSSGHDPESAASSTMKRTISSNDVLQSASKSPPKNAIAADAIIAWSVASSRAASPAKVVPPPPLRRRSKSFGMFHHRQKSSEHESSKPHVPIHTLKHTLRKHHQADEDDEENEIVKRGRRHFIRKHQHKHHEGDRKRWRDRVTDRERKRYEGVWAANRGLFTFWDFSTTAFENPSKPPTEMDAVLNIVVREIWERSRLPRSELEEVWDLVAREDANTLRRDEFVVGMWLLDQRLKGRKLPMRVSASVWSSVRHTIKIRAKP
jgi:hypothetical protein